MGSQLLRSRAVILAIGMFAGCTGQIGDGSSGSGGSVGSGTGGSGGDGTSSTLNLNGSPQYYRFVRLTNAQWGRAAQDVLNLDAPSGLEQSFQSPVIGTTDFSNNELVLDVTQESWSTFQTAAETLAAQVTATDTALAKVYSGTDPAGFITTLGRRVYRRPLTSAEQSSYLTLYNQGASLMGTRSTFAKGASLVIRAMLQSPYFLYRTEMGANGAALSGYEMAAKLSLWLRGTTPADTLLDSAAGPGKLDTADGAATLATTMLGESTATSVLRQFHSELLHFDRFAQITKVGVSNYNTSLNSEFLDVSNRFFDDILTQGHGLKEILTSTTGYVGPGTAPLYGMSAPSSGYVQQDLGSQRVGWFSQVPYLALYGFNGDPDSIHRGVTLNLDVLCATLGPPAANLPPIPPLEPGQTNRQRIDTLTSGCGSKCHNDMINPLGFSFEHFDGMGQYRDTENGGLPIDSSGSYTFVDGSTKSWDDAAGLMQVLASTPQTHTCYAKKLASFGLQRDIVASDMPLLNALTSSSMASAGSLKQMIVDLVRNDAFRTHVGGTP
jgi:Protein of unknown function (DUF1592)/Protein of unknown function (DUF1588)/Protein of unknown function (DUF1595)/Protein of unknown function (DUF1585)/Protein of unknown function (DUF1587)